MLHSPDGYIPVLDPDECVEMSEPIQVCPYRTGLSNVSKFSCGETDNALHGPTLISPLACSIPVPNTYSSNGRLAVNIHEHLQHLV